MNKEEFTQKLWELRAILLELGSYLDKELKDKE